LVPLCDGNNQFRGLGWRFGPQHRRTPTGGFLFKTLKPNVKISQGPTATLNGVVSRCLKVV
jgi:hypothetical protein